MDIKTIKKFTALLFRDLTSLGSIVFSVFLMLLLLILKENQLFWMLLVGTIATFVLTIIIRTIYFKNRPKKQEFRNYVEKIDASSFPSLHAARSVFLVLLFVYFFQSTIMTMFLIIMGLLVIYSRVFLKKHDWKDLSWGAILGAVVYWLVLFL